MKPRYFYAVCNKKTGKICVGLYRDFFGRSRSYLAVHRSRKGAIADCPEYAEVVTLKELPK